jgi:hypothetical protein
MISELVDRSRRMFSYAEQMAAADYEASSTDLAKFFGRGGKLLLWHGLDDPGPSPFATLDYERAVKANGMHSLFGVVARCR